MFDLYRDINKHTMKIHMTENDATTTYKQAVTLDRDSSEQRNDLQEPKDTPLPADEERHHLFVRRNFQRDGHTVVGYESNFIYWLRRAEKLVEAISKSDNRPIRASRDREGRTRYRLTAMGKAFYSACLGYDQSCAEHYKHHRFNPPLSVILDVVDQCSLELLDHRCGLDDLRLSVPRAREIVEGAFSSIRASCRSQAYRDTLDNYKRNEGKNIASCCEYLAAQFRRRSQLLVLRVDLYFRPEFRGWGYTRDADCHHAKFLRALRENRIVPDVLGYISKREDGVDRGIHFHVLVILDGHKHRDTANLTRVIGDDWVERCGHAEYKDGWPPGKHPRASYFNCYTRASQYRFNGLGLIHPTDSDKLRGLRSAIEYMCKETTQLKPSPPDSQEGGQELDITARKGIRNLRKGIMPKGHSGRGAPRTSGLDTSAIDRELLKK